MASSRKPCQDGHGCLLSLILKGAGSQIALIHLFGSFSLFQLNLVDTQMWRSAACKFLDLMLIALMGASLAWIECFSMLNLAVAIWLFTHKRVFSYPLLPYPNQSAT